MKAPPEEFVKAMSFAMGDMRHAWRHRSVGVAFRAGYRAAIDAAVKVAQDYTGCDPDGVEEIAAAIAALAGEEK